MSTKLEKHYLRIETGSFQYEGTTYTPGSGTLIFTDIDTQEKALEAVLDQISENVLLEQVVSRVTLADIPKAIAEYKSNFGEYEIGDIVKYTQNNLPDSIHEVVGCVDRTKGIYLISGKKDSIEAQHTDLDLYTPDLDRLMKEHEVRSYFDMLRDIVWFYDDGDGRGESTGTKSINLLLAQYVHHFLK